MSTNAAGLAQPRGPAAWKGFASGSLGAMASGAVTHPIDLVKVRMQITGALADKTAAGSGTCTSRARAPGMVSTLSLIHISEPTRPY